MEIRFPKALREGSVIVVVAPSSPVPPALEARLDLVLDAMRARGFVVRESSCLRASEAPAASVRLAAWNDALHDESVDAVIPPWGGDLAIELLAGMDFERLSRATPKWILGYSDVSTLLVPLLLEAGWASAHGPNLMDLVPGQDDPVTRAALSTLTSGDAITQRSSTHFQTAWVDWARRPSALFQLDQPTRVRTLHRAELRAQGRLIGGCIDTLSTIVGTRYGDVPRFVREHRDEGVIVFLENCELQPGQLTRALTQMRLAGWFDGVRAVLFGRSSAKETPSARFEEIVRRVLGDTELPIVLDADVGHVPPQWTLIEGALATLRVDDRAAEITQTRT